MTTIKKINFDAPPLLDRLGRGETLTTDEWIVVKAYNTLHSGKCGRSGKRTVKAHNKNW
jgi:hypothetical protein